MPAPTGTKRAVRHARKVARATVPAAAAVQAELADKGLTVTPRDAAQVSAAAVAAAPATQVRRPWRTMLRTAVQVGLGLAPMLPGIVAASGVDTASPYVAGALGISAGVTRVMSLPAVELFLQRFAPWLAAAPKAPAPSS